MRLSMLYSGEQILSFKLCLVFYAGNSLKLPPTSKPNSVTISVKTGSKAFFLKR